MFFVLAMIAAAATLGGLRNWRMTLFAALIMVVVEGVFRKWIFPGLQSYIYFVKDGLLLVAYAGFAWQVRKPIQAPAQRHIRKLVPLVVVLCALQFFNPASPSLWLVLIGIKSYFLYLPLAFLMPYAFRDEAGMLRLIRLYILFAIPVCILGFAQFYAGPESWLSVYVSHNEGPAHVSTFGQETVYGRTSGTFSYIGGFTTYLAFIGALCIGLLLLGGWRLFRERLLALTLVLVIAAMFTTGSRGPIYNIAIVCVSAAAVGAIRGDISGGALFRIVSIVPVLALMSTLVTPEAFDAFVYRAQTADSAVDRLLFPITHVMVVFGKIPFFGFGIGSTHASAVVIMGTKDYWWLGNLRVEAETARILMEVGYPGFLIVYALFATAAISSCRQLFQFRDRRLSMLSLTFLAVLLLMMISPLVNNPTGSIFYWTAIGVANAFYVFRARGWNAYAVQQAVVARPQANVLAQPFLRSGT